MQVNNKVLSKEPIYTVAIKTCHFVFNYNSGVSQTFVPVVSGNRNELNRPTQQRSLKNLRLHPNMIVSPH